MQLSAALLFSAILLSSSQAVASVYSATSQAPVNVTFEDTSLNEGTIITEFDGLHFDGFVAILESPVGQLILYDGEKAATPATSGNEIRTDFSTSKYNSLDLQSVSVGCFLSKQLRIILGTVPLSSLGLAQLATDLEDIAGTGSTAVKCVIRVEVLGMENPASLSTLKQKGQISKDCPFVPTLNVGGQGEGKVQPCDLTNLGWNGVTRFNFTIQSVGLVSIGDQGGIGSTVPVIDDLTAIGNLK